MPNSWEFSYAYCFDFRIFLCYLCDLLFKILVFRNFSCLFVLFVALP
jgi:hypothetical protein